MAGLPVFLPCGVPLPGGGVLSPGFALPDGAVLADEFPPDADAVDFAPPVLALLLLPLAVEELSGFADVVAPVELDGAAEPVAGFVLASCDEDADWPALALPLLSIEIVSCPLEGVAEVLVLGVSGFFTVGPLQFAVVPIRPLAQDIQIITVSSSKSRLSCVGWAATTILRHLRQARRSLTAGLRHKAVTFVRAPFV